MEDGILAQASIQFIFLLYSFRLLLVSQFLVGGLTASEKQKKIIETLIKIHKKQKVKGNMELQYGL